MAGKIQPLRVVKGETRALKFTAVDGQKGVYVVMDGETVEGARQDLTGQTLEFQVNYPAGAADPPVIAKTSAGSGGIVLGNQADASTRGDFTVTLDPADTSSETAKRYTYDVVAISGSGARKFLVEPSEFLLVEPVNRA